MGYERRSDSEGRQEDGGGFVVFVYVCVDGWVVGWLVVLVCLARRTAYGRVQRQAQTPDNLPTVGLK